MYYLVNFFTTREWAIIFWMIIASAIVIWCSDKQIIKNTIEVIFNKYVIAVFVVIVTWTIFVTFGLHTIGLWSIDLLKYTIFAIIFIGLASCIKLASGKDAQSNPKTRNEILKELMKKAVAWTTIVTIFVNVYTFSFWTEVVLIAFIVIIALVDVDAEIKEKNQIVKICNAILALIGIVMVGWTVVQIYQNAAEFFTCNNLLKLAFKSIMLFLYFPLFMLFARFCAFERSFFQINRFVANRDQKLAKYFKRKLIISYLLSITELEKFPIGKINDVKSKAEIDLLIKKEKIGYRNFNKPLSKMTAGNRKIFEEYIGQVLRMIELIEPILTAYHDFTNEMKDENALIEIAKGLYPEIEQLYFDLEHLDGVKDLKECFESLSSSMYGVARNYGSDIMLKNTPENRKLFMEIDARDCKKWLEKFRKIEAQFKK